MRVVARDDGLALLWTRFAPRTSRLVSSLIGRIARSRGRGIEFLEGAIGVVSPIE